MRGALQRGIGIAGKSDSTGAAAARNFDRRQSKRSASAGSHANYDVVFPRLAPGHFVAPLLGIILADLGVGGQSLGASGDDELNAINIERGRTLSRVQSGNASARSRPDIDNSAAFT